jgi:glutathione reductase (NADPH)
MAGSEHLITSNLFLELHDLPQDVIFLGGGFISFEFAHFAARIGREKRRIRIIETAEKPLGSFDDEMVDLLVKASEEEGIEILSNTQISSIEKLGTGFTLSTASNERLETDMVIHGAGRTPDLDDLDLETGGIQYTRQGITVSSKMQTSNPHVFAIGDCAASIMLARVADYEAHVAARNILAQLGHAEPASIDYEAVPTLLFTYPQLGMVGKTEGALKEEGVKYMKSSDKNLQWPTYKRVGLKHAAYKILVGMDDRFLGAHILSDNASGLISIIRQAMLDGTTLEELHRRSIMNPYPTRESDLTYMLSGLVE